MATERKLNSVWFFFVFWDGEELFRATGSTARRYLSYAEVPEWLRERAAVLRLLDEGEHSPLGMWKNDEWENVKKDVDYYVVLQPGDPEWSEQQ